MMLDRGSKSPAWSGDPQFNSILLKVLLTFGKVLQARRSITFRENVNELPFGSRTLIELFLICWPPEESNNAKR